MIQIAAQIEPLAEERRAWMRAFWDRPSGIAWAAHHSALVDRTIERVYEIALAEHPALATVGMIATGGYGRRELSPYSDVDLTLVPPEPEGPQMEEGVRVLFRLLQTAFGSIVKLEVGYAYRLLSDLPGIDATTRTGLLDARHVAGDPQRLEELRPELHRTLDPGEFVLAKLAERRAAYRKHHDTPLVAEPHLKEGAGGLRDLQCGNWIRHAIGEQPRAAGPAFETVLTIRNALHLCVGKLHDEFGRARQSEVCERLGRTTSETLEELTCAMLRQHQEYEDALRRVQEARFPLSAEVWAVMGEARVQGNAEAGAAAVGISVATKLGLRVSEIPSACQTVRNGAAALYAVSSGEDAIRNLDRAGILELLLPELTACRTFHSEDSVHTWTVFEHSLRTLRNLESLSPGTFLGDLKEQLPDLEPLYLAALLHDVGKRIPGEDHAMAGARIAREIGERWHLASDVVDVVEWLVREHLLMAHYIRVRDVEKPQTAIEFARIVRTPERLIQLALLTWADVNAVSASAWTASQGAFLERLYRETARVLEGEGEPDLDPGQYRQRLLRQLAKDPVDAGALEAFLQSLPAHYVTTTTPELARLHLELAQKAVNGTPSLEVSHRPELSATEITFCGRDQAGLLSRLLGVLYANDLSVLSIRACTTEGDHPVALDTFTVSFGGRTVPAATLRIVGDQALGVLRGELDSDALLRSKGKEPERRQEFFTAQFVPGDPGILEVRAPRGRGMAFRLSRWIAAQSWNIVAARIGQWAGNASAAFYIEGRDGRPLNEEEVQAALARHD